jgi:hypothetical protein
VKDFVCTVTNHELQPWLTSVTVVTAFVSRSTDSAAGSSWENYHMIGEHSTSKIEGTMLWHIFDEICAGCMIIRSHACLASEFTAFYAKTQPFVLEFQNDQKFVRFFFPSFIPT